MFSIHDISHDLFFLKCIPQTLEIQMQPSSGHKISAKRLVEKNRTDEAMKQQVKKEILHEEREMKKKV